MFTKEAIDSYLRPIGYKTTVKSIEAVGDWLIYDCSLSCQLSSGEVTELGIAFSLPTLDTRFNRIFSIDGGSGKRKRVVCHKAISDCMSPVVPDDITVIPWQETVMQALNDITSESLMDFHFGGAIPDDDTITQRMSKWLNTAPHIIDINEDDPRKVESVLASISMEVIEQSMSHIGRLFNRKWIGKIDPTSTPTSKKVNISYRLSQGSTVENGLVKGSGYILCDVVANNAIAVQYLPRRVYLLRTTFENSVSLVNPEEPKLQPRKNTLSGKHLYTAIMHHGVNTHEDGIAISKSAAQDMSAFIEKHETLRSSEQINVLVKVGDIVKHGAVLAISDGAKLVRATKVLSDVVVKDIKLEKVIYQGKVTNCCTITLLGVYPLETGDKISNRSAGKGVVRIVEDNEMPVDESGRRIDICIGPEAVYGRRSMLLYWEMMAIKAMSDNMVVKPSVFDPEPSFDELVQRGYGKKQQLTLSGKPLPELTFCGEVFWIRLNKHAREAITARGEEAILNQYDLPEDDAKASGQRQDLAKSMALDARGLTGILDYTIEQSKPAVKRLKDLMRVLFPDIPL